MGIEQYLPHQQCVAQHHPRWCVFVIAEQYRVEVGTIATSMAGQRMPTKQVFFSKYAAPCKLSAGSAEALFLRDYIDIGGCACGHCCALGLGVVVAGAVLPGQHDSCI